VKKRTKESNFNNRNKLYPSITRVLLFRKVRFIFNFVNCNHSSGVFRIDGVEFSELEINKQFHYFFFVLYKTGSLCRYACTLPFSEGFVTCNPVRLRSGEDPHFTIVQKADTGGGWRVMYCARGRNGTDIGSVELSC
jgi:hypothetical protein